MDPAATEFDLGDDLPPPPSRPPPTVAGYDVLGEIGKGGMGVVYQARHRRLGRIVALKLLRAGALAGPSERERFFREARAGAALQHAHIVQVYDVGEHAGCPFLALEYVSGGSLALRLAVAPLEPRAAAQLVADLAGAVQFAHDAGIVHRDLKPANVLMASGDRQRPVDSREPNPPVDDDSRSPIPKIADFGLARLLAEDAGATASGAVIGTPSYMAPEQAVGAKNVGPAADVYALGAILYECLTDRPPFRAATVVDTLDQVRSADPVSPSRLQPAVPRDLNTVCLKCLEKDPGRRYASAADLAADLGRFLAGEPVLAHRIGAVGRIWRWCHRNPRDACLLTALVLAIAVGFLGVFDQWRRAEGLYTLAESRRATADAERVTAEANLRRYEQAADDFAGLIDTLETDQLFHLRSDPLRPELVVPALRRNQEFLTRFGGDPARRADTVRARFRVAVLTRVLCTSPDLSTYATALEASRQALAALTEFAGERPTIVQYQRDRAALTQLIGYLLHATRKSAEGVTVLEDACQQRQSLLDAEPNQLDYRSELGSCWNDLGLALTAADRPLDAVHAYERAADLQRVAVETAPQVPRYWRHLCNHHFNRAMALVHLDRPADAAAAAAEGPRLMPHEPEQWIRQARILALLAAQSRGSAYAEPALAALRQAVALGFNDLTALDNYGDLNAIRKRPEFLAIRDGVARKITTVASQAP